MPLSLFEKLGVGVLKPTNISLQLADKSVKRPKGIIEDVLVKVDKLILPVDFIVLEMVEGDPKNASPLIFGRPFMATTGTKINVKKGTLKMKVLGQSVEFQVFKPLLDPDDELLECFYVEGTKESHDSPKGMHEPPPSFENTKPPWNNEDALKELPFFDEHKMEQAPSLNELQMKAIEDLREALGIRKPKKRPSKKRFAWPPPRSLTPIFPFKCCGGMNNGETSTKASGKKECFEPP
jgi:hypothetical protein